MGPSSLGATGRLARSVAMITQRPTIESLRNSGIGKLRRLVAMEGKDRSMKFGHRSHIPHYLLEIRGRTGQVDGAFAGSAVPALLAFLKLDEELHGLAFLHAEHIEGDRRFQDAVDADLDAAR